jgi:hypothetical protein
VIDDQAVHRHPKPPGTVHGRGGQCQRVSTAGTRHRHRARLVRDLVGDQEPVHRDAHLAQGTVWLGTV